MCVFEELSDDESSCEEFNFGNEELESSDDEPIVIPTRRNKVDQQAKKLKQRIPKRKLQLQGPPRKRIKPSTVLQNAIRIASPLPPIPKQRKRRANNYGPPSIPSKKIASYMNISNRNVVKLFALIVTARESRLW